MIAIIKDIWEETRPKIYEVAKTEHGSAIKALYDESASSDSEGICNIFIRLYYTYVLLL